MLSTSHAALRGVADQGGGVYQGHLADPRARHLLDGAAAAVVRASFATLEGVWTGQASPGQAALWAVSKMMYSSSSSSLVASAEAAGVLETAVVRTALGEHQMCAALDDAIQAARVATLRHQAWLLSLSEASNPLSYDDKVQTCATPSHEM
jgi:hypothetical protein